MKSLTCSNHMMNLQQHVSNPIMHWDEVSKHMNVLSVVSSVRIIWHQSVFHLLRYRSCPLSCLIKKILSWILIFLQFVFPCEQSYLELICTTRPLTLLLLEPNLMFLHYSVSFYTCSVKILKTNSLLSEYFTLYKSISKTCCYVMLLLCCVITVFIK